MEVKVLPKDISERFRSDTRINSFAQCILELIFNSLDAKATSIAVRINITKHQVRVVDNGHGITLNDLHNVGRRYMTSKCESLYNYEIEHKFYGYRGEALASIICISEQLIITSRSETDELTYSKKFENNSFINIVPSKSRSSKGTTVVVKKFFINCPVKQKRISSNIDLNNIKVLLQSLAVIHPSVSFSLRDDITGKIILNCFKMKTVSKSFCAMFEDIFCTDLIQVKVSKGSIHVSGLIYIKSYKNCKPQLIYVNKRPVNIYVIEKYVKETLSQILDDTTESHPVFIINISCPYSEIDILYDSSNILIEFRSYDVVLKCVEKMIKLFSNKYRKLLSPQKESLSNYEMNEANVIPEENVVDISIAKDKPGTTGTCKLKSEELLSNLNNKQNITGTKHKQRIFANLRKMNQCKTLGLKKAKFALRKKQRSVFEKSVDLSTLSYQDFSPNMPLKREKVMKNANCLKDMVDQRLDSRNLFISNKQIFKNSLPGKEFEDAAGGKEFVMDLFLKSLTPPLPHSTILCNEINNEAKLLEKPGEVSQNRDHMDDLSLENTMLSVRTYSSNVKFGCNKDEISANKKNIKRQRMEKLNSIGTSLIKNKLLQVKGINRNDKSAQTDSLIIAKKLKSVGTSPIKGGRKLKRTLSENKSIQTSFISNKTHNIECTCVQTRFNNNNLQLLAENVVYEKCSETSTKKGIHLSVFHSTYQHSNIEDNIKDDNTCQYNKNNHDFNNMTFVSHYDMKLRERCCKKQEPPCIELNTKDALVNLSTVLSKKINKADNKCEVFENIFENGTNNRSYQFPNEDHTFSLDYEITSDFFGIKSTSKQLKNHKESGRNRDNFSVLMDTSRFFQNHENSKINFTKESNYNNISQNSSKYGICNQTIIPFEHFIPPIQSTQKDKKYDGKVYDFFKLDSKQKISSIDTCITHNFFGEVNSGFIKSCINDCTQQLSSTGEIYHTNKKTDTATKNYFRDESKFLLKKRTDFIPKGLSPILNEINHVNISLSPTSKKNLNNAIIETYENELELIKWQQYVDKKDPMQFFDALYQVKNKQIEQSIPNICVLCPKTVKKVFPLNTTYSFTTDIFIKLNVLGQLDNKFIAVLHNYTLIILLDQHAVHERIRVEELLKDYTLQNGNSDRVIFKSVQCNEPFIINYTNTELQILKNFRLQFETLGLFFEIHDAFIKIVKIPLCLANKSAHNINAEETLSKFVNSLINDELHLLRSTRGILSNIPKIIQYAINNEACRGAVKFGQKLTYSECCKYIEDLSKCALPFQCAHGRPTLYPILEICSFNGVEVRHYNLRKLKNIL